MLPGESVTPGSAAHLVIPNRCLNPKRCLKTPHLWAVAITQPPPASHSRSPTLIYGHLNYLGTKQHGKNAPVARRGWGCPRPGPHSGQLPPSRVSAWDNLLGEGSSVQDLAFTDHHLEGKAFGACLACWCSHGRCHGGHSVPWLMGRWGLQHQRGWKHPEVLGSPDEQWGNSAALPPSHLSGASGSCESCRGFSEQLPVVQPHHPKVFGEQSHSAWSMSTSSAVQGPGSRATRKAWMLC